MTRKLSTSEMELLYEIYIANGRDQEAEAPIPCLVALEKIPAAYQLAGEGLLSLTFPQEGGFVEGRDGFLITRAGVQAYNQARDEFQRSVKEGWHLWGCDQETGREGWLASGSEETMRKIMERRANLGRDVWLRDPAGEKHYPSTHPLGAPAPAPAEESEMRMG